MTGLAAEIDTFIAAWRRVADELIAAADTPSQARLDAARRAFDESGVYLDNMTEQARRLQC